MPERPGAHSGRSDGIAESEERTAGGLPPCVPRAVQPETLQRI